MILQTPSRGWQRHLHALAPASGTTVVLPVTLFVVGMIGGFATDRVCAEQIDYTRDIRPILSDNCYACHGPDREQRRGGGPEGLRLDIQAGAIAKVEGRRAIVPGKPQESELIRRIFATDPDDVMPPSTHRKKLSDSQKRLLRDWISQGAPWESHWSFIAPQRHTVPPVRARQWVRNWIDHFILRQLEARQITPSPPAERRILIRRLHQDLIGMPPSLSDLQGFIADDSPLAYETLVDRLLASPHFGERLAVYWLDLVRYADSVGYHGDQPVSVSPYRDYVITALNAGKPFDEFTLEQLAGDLIDNPSRAQLVASGYNRLGMMSAEGGVQPKEYLAKYAADRVRTAASVWLGITLGCAECHDHKFDPFRTKDFYRFAAFFADIQERGLYGGNNFGPKLSVEPEFLDLLVTPLQQQIADLETELQKTSPEFLAALRAWENEYKALEQRWTIVRSPQVRMDEGLAAKTLDDQSILVTGSGPNQTSYELSFDCPVDQPVALRLEVLPDQSLPKLGPGRAGNGNFVVTELRLVALAADQTVMPIKLKSASATVEQTASVRGNPHGKWSAASAIDGDTKGANWGWAVLPEVGRPQHLVVQIDGTIHRGERLQLLIDQRHQNGNHTLGRFRIALGGAAEAQADKRLAIAPDVRRAVYTPEKFRSLAQIKKLKDHFRPQAKLLEPIRKKIASLKAEQEALTKQLVRTTLVTRTVAPRPMRVLPRGNWMDDSGEVVQPGIPAHFGQPRGSGRLNRVDLARWLSSPDNPLTARVMANRVWKLLFGSGLSKVLDDLGAQGEAPTHPELLDNLAMEFVDSGWDLKHLIRTIVLSASYRQSSLPRADLAATDPYNRLIARQSRFRMDAELIRDQALEASGLLVKRLGGRSAKPYQPAGLYRHLNFPARRYQADNGANQYRRGVYTHWQRQFLHPAMKSFDAPAREECAAERPRSNTPLAALVLLNDPSYVEAARMLAEAILRESSDARVRIDLLMKRVLSRPGTEDEARILTTLLAGQRKRYQSDVQRAKEFIAVGQSTPDPNLNVVELAAWTSVARAVLNLHETITRN